ncbi:disulfide isomerase DsbC N-terminal domain-containing protein [Vreelandella massiliensis]|uniref:disulfide isomerase DsbC N-terminal domain-containing protein n=1 Tax=Vreelandella massiliensis TaxID=1816686 RepID=UPI00096A272B|nr:disulfide isomerase DsbC N-terminal domain-containing protein [Halomonas massiliensis]
MRVATTTAAVAVFSATLALTANAETTDTPNLGVRDEVNPLIPHLGSLKPHAMTELPVKGLVGVESDGEVLFITDNGRYVFQGRAHDLWYNMPLDSMENINKSATKLNIADMGIDTRRLTSLTLGDPDLPVEQVHNVFIDPMCEHCLEYVEQVAELDPSTYGSVSFVVIPALGESSYAPVEHFACLKDDVSDEQVLDALLDQEITSLPRVDEDNCDLTAYHSTLVLAEQLRVDGVPFTATASGGVIRGIPKDISTALSRAE